MRDLINFMRSLWRTIHPYPETPEQETPTSGPREQWVRDETAKAQAQDAKDLSE